MSLEEILETIRMTEVEHFDIRTVTMGINIKDCASDDLNKLKSNIYEKLMRIGSEHVASARKVESDYGLSIANKRIAVTPLSIAADGFHEEDYVEIARVMDKASDELGIDYLGGFSALVQKGWSMGELNLIKAIPEALSVTKHVCSSINVATTKAGINMDAVKLMGKIIKQTAAKTADKDAIGCAKLVVFANVPEDNPFIAGAFHGVSEPDVVVNVGLSGPGVILRAVREAPDNMDFADLSDRIRRMAFKITRAGEFIGKKVASLQNVPFGIVDISLAPTPMPGDSVADILRAMGLEDVGAAGTTAALALLNDSVKRGGLMASSNVGGMSGAFIPVSEDYGMIQAVKKGHIPIEKLEAMTCVCSVGLDMIAIPGDTSEQVISGVIADECALGIMNNKTTAVRIIPAPGKNVGDSVTFGGLLGEAPIMSVSKLDNIIFINRGGRFPAPVKGINN
ncbi:MAG: PFL family protein [Calditrichaceae bacterium]|nr:PFL family protein [Calditrichaceae bacterium]MBN2709033.1 PFL family protein [Calditrichaceae bacterium]